MERFLTMAIRMLLRRGIDAGIRMGVERMKPRGTPEQDAAARKQGAEAARRARQAMRVTRRVTRF